MPQLFLDMDGVLADFEHGYQRLTGHKAGYKGSLNWRAIDETPDFFYHLPPMPGFFKFQEFTHKHKPIVLTSIPSSVPNVEDQKRRWLNQYWNGVPMIATTGIKASHATPGDVLVDDWDKHQKHWEDMGGVWVLFTTAEAAIEALKAKGFT
jgi:hypothetical protein